MRLTDWMQLVGFLDPDVARRVGLDRVTICRWRTGARVPSVASMRKIAEISGGLVTANDWTESGPRVSAPQNFPPGHRRPGRARRSAPKAADDGTSEEAAPPIHRDSL
jgi:hypothetical protein